MGRAFSGRLIDETIDHVIVTFANNFFRSDVHLQFSSFFHTPIIVASTVISSLQ
jgi:hypothetical protein